MQHTQKIATATSLLGYCTCKPGVPYTIEQALNSILGDAAA
jgi:hypothetical protein